MENFRAASSLTEGEFDAVLRDQRAVFEANRAVIERFDCWERVTLAGRVVCPDCGAIHQIAADCPICATVNRAKLPLMIWGTVFG